MRDEVTRALIAYFSVLLTACRGEFEGSSGSRGVCHCIPHALLPSRLCLVC